MMKLKEIIALFLLIVSVLSLGIGCADITAGAEETSEDSTVEWVTKEITTARDVFISVPALIGKTEAEIISIFDNTRIEYTIEYKHSDAAEGTIIECDYVGKDGGLYISVNEAYPIALVVSLGPEETTAPPSPPPLTGDDLPTNVEGKGEKVVYLTFDDGPNKHNDAVLEILDRYGVKATFFTVGDFVSYYPQRVRNMVEAGHKLACHTNTHDFNTIYLSPEALVNDIKNWEANVEKALGYLPEEKIFRFPGGSNNYALPKADFPAFYQAVKEAGYTSFDWTCANNDRYLGGKPEDMPEVEYLKRSAIETVGSCSAYYPKIMLMHDTTSPTVEALPYIIETLQASGYTFATLDELDSDWLFRLSYK